MLSSRLQSQQIKSTIILQEKKNYTLLKGWYLNETILYIQDKDFIYIIVVQGHVVGATPLPTPTSTENRLPIPPSNYQLLPGAHRPSETQERMNAPQNPESPTGPSAANSHPGKRTENRPTTPIRPESRATATCPIQRTMTKLSKSLCELDKFNSAFQYHFIPFFIITFTTKKKQIT